MVRVLVVVLVVVASALAYSQTLGKHKAKLAAPAKASFCELGVRLTGLLASAGVPTTGPIPASLGPAAFKNVFTQMGGHFKELQDAAPSASRGNVKTVISAVQQAGAGDATGIHSPAFAKGERALAAFLRTGPCGDPAVNGGGS